MQTTKLYLLDTEKLQDETVLSKYFATVSKSRQEKTMRFRFAKDRALSVGAGLLLNRGLREWGLRECEMRYSLGANEKPCLPDYPDIHFNISHSGHHVICAFGPDEVGCDIELISEIDLNIAKKFFYHSEYDYIAGQATDFERQQAFFRLWTLKESFMKITGRGMSLPLDAFRVYFKGDRVLVDQNVDAQPYFFHEYDCEPHYKVACCSHTDAFADSVMRLVL